MNDVMLTAQPQFPFAGRRILPPYIENAVALLQTPAIRRVLPMAITVLALSLGLTAYFLLREPVRTTLFAGMPEAEKAAVVTALRAAKIDVVLDPQTGTVQIPADQLQNARMLLAAQGLPDTPATGYDLLSAIPLGTSRAIEEARLHQTLETELARSLMDINGISHARVHLAVAEQSAFVRQSTLPSASVFIKLLPGRVLDEAQVNSIRQLVSSSVPRLSVAGVSVVDQRGNLLSPQADAGPFAEGERQFKYQQRLEQAWRDRISTLLTPMLGNDAFSTEVSLDLDFTEVQSTRETYDPSGVLRSEQASKSPSVSLAAPSGIPGALSNIVPVAAQPAPLVSAVSVPVVPSPVTPVAVAENYTRNFEVGKEVSVHKSHIGSIRRASVAVLVQDMTAANGKTKKRSTAELAMIQKLLSSAVGLETKRGDSITVSSSSFAAVPDTPLPPFWQKAWLPGLAQPLAALAIFLAGLFFGLRPLLKAMTAQKTGAETITESDMGLTRKTKPLNGDDIAAYHEKMTAIQNFVRSDEARASLALREMLHGSARNTAHE